MRIDMRASRELTATVLAIRALDRTIQKMIRQQTKRITAPEWRGALSERADSRLQHAALVDTSAVAVSNQNIRLQSANKGRALSGGFNPKTDWYAAEFGGDQGKTTTYTRAGHRVTRHTTRQLPTRRKAGHVFYPATAEMIPRIAALWVQTTVRTIATAFEGRQE
jgi:hypothetical protein